MSDTSTADSPPPAPVWPRRLGVAFLALLPMAFIWNDRWHDVGLYYEWAGRLLAGAVPYRDMPFEYPPLVAPLLLLPRFVGSSLLLYGGAFCFLMLLFDVLQKIALYRTAPVGMGRVAVALHGLLGMWLYVTYLKRFDVAAATCMTLALVMLLRRPGSRGAWVAWGLGVGLKVFPVFVAPALLWHSWRCRVGLRRLASQCAVGAATVAAPLMLSWWYTGPQTLSWLAYHRERGVQVGSSYAAVAVLLQGLGQPIAIRHDYGAMHLAAPWALPWGHASTFIMVGAVLLTYAIMLPRRANLWRLATAVILALLCTSKVFSPQYVSWLLPLGIMAVVRGPFDWRLLLGLLAITGLTAELFPGEGVLVKGVLHKQLALVARASVVLLVWGYLLRRPRAAGALLPPQAKALLRSRAAPAGATAAAVSMLAAAYVVRTPAHFPWDFYAAVGLTAALGAWVLQALGAHSWTAAVAACVYALLPYQFMAGSYFMVPLAGWVLLSQLELGGPVRPLGRYACLAIACVMPLFDAYQAFFFAYLAVATAILRGVRLRRGLELACAVGVGSWLTWLAGGSLSSGGGASVGPLRLIQLIVPPEGHRLETLRRVSARYAKGALLPDSSVASLGLLGGLLFLAVMGACLATLWAKDFPDGALRSRLRQLLVLNLLCLVCAASQRMVLFPAFFAVVGAVWLAPRCAPILPPVTQRWHFARVLGVACLALVIWDMHDVEFLRAPWYCHAP